MHVAVKERTGEHSEVQSFGPTDDFIATYMIERLFPSAEPSEVIDAMRAQLNGDYHGSYGIKNPLDIDYDLDENETLFWKMLSTVNSRDAYLHHLYIKTVHSPSRKHKLELVETLAHMMHVDEVFADFLDAATENIDECRH